MKEWKKIKLKEVLTEITEKNKEQKVEKVLSVTNSKGFVSQEEYFQGTVHSENISNYKIVRKNQFAYNPSRVNVGSINILQDYQEGALSPMYVIFEVDRTKLLPEYFKYYFQTHSFFENVKNNTQGSVRNSLNFKTLCNFEYLLPPIEEQKKIVKILENIDKILFNLDYEILQNEIFINSLFFNILKKYKNRKVKLKDLVTYKKGFAFKSKEYVNEGCRIIRVSDLGEKAIKDNGEKIFIENSKKNIYKEYELNKDDLIVTTVGSKPPIYSSVAGRVIKVDSNHEGCLLNQNTIRLRVNNEDISPIILYSQFNNKRYYDYLNIIMRGNANQGNITVEELLNYEIEILDKKIQMRLEKVLTLGRDKNRYLELKKEKYIVFKKALMQKLLTGKIRVKI